MNANMKGIKNKISTWIKDFRALNCEAKIGILFLIPPIIGVIFFILNLFDADVGFDAFPDSWNYSYDASPVIPIYLGLMAIAGAYLIKGNLKKGE